MRPGVQKRQKRESKSALSDAFTSFQMSESLLVTCHDELLVIFVQALKFESFCLNFFYINCDSQFLHVALQFLWIVEIQVKLLKAFPSSLHVAFRLFRVNPPDATPSI